TTVSAPMTTTETSLWFWRTKSTSSLSLEWEWWSWAQGKDSAPSPSGPWSRRPSTSYSIAGAVPRRGKRGGSICSTRICTFRVACSQGTLPAVAAKPRTSKSGSRRASATAKAPSIPGSVTSTTFLVIDLPQERVRVCSRIRTNAALRSIVRVLANAATYSTCRDSLQSLEHLPRLAGGYSLSGQINSFHRGRHPLSCHQCGCRIRKDHPSRGAFLPMQDRQDASHALLPPLD